MTSGQETKLVYSYNLGARIGSPSQHLPTPTTYTSYPLLASGIAWHYNPVMMWINMDGLLHYNCLLDNALQWQWHFARQLLYACTGMSSFWILLELRVLCHIWRWWWQLELWDMQSSSQIVTTSNWRPANALPVSQPTVSEKRWEVKKKWSHGHHVWCRLWFRSFFWQLWLCVQIIRCQGLHGCGMGGFGLCCLECLSSCICI